MKKWTHTLVSGCQKPRHPFFTELPGEGRDKRQETSECKGPPHHPQNVGEGKCWKWDHLFNRTQFSFYSKRLLMLCQEWRKSLIHREWLHRNRWIWPWEQWRPGASSWRVKLLWDGEDTADFVLSVGGWHGMLAQWPEGCSLTGFTLLQCMPALNFANAFC